MLTRIWDLLFHRHKWVIIRKGHLTDSGYRQSAVGHYYHMQCSTCGKLKQKEFY